MSSFFASAPTAFAPLNADVVARTDLYQSEHALYERYADTSLPAGYLGLRLDGRSFHTLTREMRHPFDPAFDAAMAAAATALMRDEIGFRLCYWQSDEITLILEPGQEPFSRRLEKLVSVAASIASAAASLALGQAAVFDGRALVLGQELDALAALAERQQDAVKNAVTSLAYWTLRERGLSGRAAERQLRPLKMRARIDLCTEMGSPFSDLSAAYRVGRMLTWEPREHVGYNPLTKSSVTVMRRQLQSGERTPDFRTLSTLPGLGICRKVAP